MAGEQLQGTPDPVEAAAQAGSALAIIATTLNGLTETVGRIERKTDRQSDRMDELTNTTNHALHEFRDDNERFRVEQAQALLAFQGQVSAAVATKVDRKDINAGALLWAELKTNRILQAVFVTLFAAMAPVVADHWHLIYERFSF